MNLDGGFGNGRHKLLLQYGSLGYRQLQPHTSNSGTKENISNLGIGIWLRSILSVFFGKEKKSKGAGIGSSGSEPNLDGFLTYSCTHSEAPPDLQHPNTAAFRLLSFDTAQPTSALLQCAC